MSNQQPKPTVFYHHSRKSTKSHTEEPQSGQFLAPLLGKYIYLHHVTIVATLILNSLTNRSSSSGNGPVVDDDLGTPQNVPLKTPQPSSTSSVAVSPSLCRHLTHCNFPSSTSHSLLLSPTHSDISGEQKESEGREMKRRSRGRLHVAALRRLMSLHRSIPSSSSHPPPPPRPPLFSRPFIHVVLSKRVHLAPVQVPPTPESLPSSSPPFITAAPLFLLRHLLSSGLVRSDIFIAASFYIHPTVPPFFSSLLEWLFSSTPSPTLLF